MLEVDQPDMMTLAIAKQQSETEGTKIKRITYSHILNGWGWCACPSAAVPEVQNLRHVELKEQQTSLKS